MCLTKSDGLLGCFGIWEVSVRVIVGGESVLVGLITRVTEMLRACGVLLCLD